MKSKNIIVWGGVFAFLSVAIGAFGAHALHLEASDREIWQTATYYQFFHALALILFGSLEKTSTRVPSILFVIGIILFSGSLYTLVLTGGHRFGAITPMGGILFLVGWLIFVFKTISSK